MKNTLFPPLPCQYLRKNLSMLPQKFEIHISVLNKRVAPRDNEESIDTTTTIDQRYIANLRGFSSYIYIGINYNFPPQTSTQFLNTLQTLTR